jgi:hypothetical protein
MNGDAPVPRGRGRARRRTLLAAPGVLGLALAAAACGGGPPRAVAHLPTTTKAPTAAAGGGHQAYGGALVQYAACMRAQGVASFPDPGSLQTSAAIRAFKSQVVHSVASLASSPTFQTAQRACAQYYGPPTTSPPVSPQEMEKLLAVARCMRSHGVAGFPDPNPATGAMDPPPGISKDSPIVVAALRACSSLGRAAGLGPPNTGN